MRHAEKSHDQRLGHERRDAGDQRRQERAGPDGAGLAEEVGVEGAHAAHQEGEGEGEVQRADH